ncbi:MAG: lytic transglycosylase domain-containing protein [Christensenellaceae bacterium]|nr:lytic transglycosylase domain-containing protein [Christensenellaceae bacterium]
MSSEKKKKSKKAVWICAGLLAVLIIAAVLLRPTVLEWRYPLKYQEYVEKYSDEYGLDKLLVYSVIKCESSFEADARSRAGACGLMQLMPATAKWFAENKVRIEYSEEMLFEPEYNIRLGCAYLDYLKGRFDGNMGSVLAAYNAGEGIVRQWLNSSLYSADGENLNAIPYPETENYVERVQDTYDMYVRLYREN